MATVYFGDGWDATTNGNWNTVSNWYSTPASLSSSNLVGGTPLGRLPQAGDSVVIQAPLTGGPTGTWAGNVTVQNKVLSIGNSLNQPTTPTTPNLGAGTFSGTVTLGPGGTYRTNQGSSTYYLMTPVLSGTVIVTGPLVLCGATSITGGSYSGAISVGTSNGLGSFPSPITNASQICPAISGGTFTGSFTPHLLNGPSTAVYWPFNVTGGTFSPSFTISASNPGAASYPYNPGFGFTGGTYSPNVTLGSAPVITNALTITCIAGNAFPQFTITASNSPTSYSATGLPTGLSCNASTGVISGTPTTAGQYTATITATNSSGSGSQTLIFDVNNAITTINVSVMDSDLGAAIQDMPALFNWTSLSGTAFTNIPCTCSQLAEGYSLQVAGNIDEVHFEIVFQTSQILGGVYPAAGQRISLAQFGSNTFTNYEVVSADASQDGVAITLLVKADHRA